MFGETYAGAHLNLEASMSCPSTFTLVTNPTSDVGTWSSFPQGMPFIDDERVVNAWPPNNLQVNPEAYPRAAGPQKSIQLPLPPVQENDKGAGTLYPENAITGINDENCSATHPLDSMDRKTPHFFSPAHPACISPGPSRLRGPECFGPVQVIFDENVIYADVDQTPSRRQQDFSISSTATEKPCSISVSHLSLQQPPGASRSAAPERPYSCNACDKRYARLQGVKRHQREAHEALLCKYCLTFTWGRPYRYRQHLIKCHPVVDANAALDEAIAVRRTAATLTQHRRQGLVFLPTLEHREDGFTEGETPTYLPFM